MWESEDVQKKNHLKVGCNSLTILTLIPIFRCRDLISLCHHISCSDRLQSQHPEQIRHWVMAQYDQLLIRSCLCTYSNVWKPNKATYFVTWFNLTYMLYVSIDALNVTNRFFNSNNEKNNHYSGACFLSIKKKMLNRRCQSAVIHCYQTVFSIQMKKRNNLNAHSPGWPTSSSPPCDGCLCPKLTPRFPLPLRTSRPSKSTCCSTRHSPRPPPALALFPDWQIVRPASTPPPLRFPTNEARGARTSLQRSASRLVGSAGVCAP